MRFPAGLAIGPKPAGAGLGGSRSSPPDIKVHGLSGSGAKLRFSAAANTAYYDL